MGPIRNPNHLNPKHRHYKKQTFRHFLIGWIAACLWIATAGAAAAQDLARQVQGQIDALNAVTEETYYDTYDQNMNVTWQLVKSLYNAGEPGLRMSLAEAAIAMFDKTLYPDDQMRQRFHFERFTALYSLGRQEEANALLGSALTGQFLRDYLPDNMQGLTARASYRQGQLAIEAGKLYDAGFILVQAAKDIAKTEGGDAPARLQALSGAALSLTLVDSANQALRPLTQALEQGGLSSKTVNALTWRVAELHLLSGDMEEAANWFERAYGMAPIIADLERPLKVNRLLAAANVLGRAARNSLAETILTKLLEAARQQTAADPMLRSRVFAAAYTQALRVGSAGADAGLLAEALAALDADPLPDFAWRQVLLLHSNVSGTSPLSTAEMLLAQRNYEAARDAFRAIAEDPTSPNPQIVQATLGLVLSEARLTGPRPNMPDRLLTAMDARGAIPDPLARQVLFAAAELALETQQEGVAVRALDRLEELLFAYRQEGHPDLFRVASLRAVQLLLAEGKAVVVGGEPDSFGATLQRELHKILYDAARWRGLTSPAVSNVLMPQVHFGLWRSAFLAGNDSNGRPVVTRNNLLQHLLALQGWTGSTEELRTLYDWSLNVLGVLWHMQGEEFTTHRAAGLSALADISAANKGYLGREAAYVASLIGDGVPRETEIIRSQQVLAARGFNSTAMLAVLFGGETEEDKRIREILRYRLRRDLIDPDQGDQYGYPQSMMSDMAYDPETGTHIGFAPFNVQSNPTNSLTERVAAISDCLKDARPWADCRITYDPLAGGELSAEEADDCRLQGLNAEKREAIEARYRPKIKAAEEAQNWDLSSQLENQKYEALQEGSLSEFFPGCWVYEKGPGIIDPSVSKVKPQIDLSRIIRKK